MCHHSIFPRFQKDTCITDKDVSVVHICDNAFIYLYKRFIGNERESLEQGGKIILPPSALDQLTRLNIVYPMLFKLTNASVRFFVWLLNIDLLFVVLFKHSWT